MKHLFLGLALLGSFISSSFAATMDMCSQEKILPLQKRVMELESFRSLKIQHIKELGLSDEEVESFEKFRDKNKQLLVRVYTWNYRQSSIVSALMERSPEAKSMGESAVLKLVKWMDLDGELNINRQEIIEAQDRLAEASCANLEAIGTDSSDRNISKDYVLVRSKLPSPSATQE